MPDLDVIDHLVLAVPDLAVGIDHVEHLTGVRPAIGGCHPDWGTHNAVLAAGPHCYLEIIAADPNHPVPASQRPGIFMAVDWPHMIGWFAKCGDLPAAAHAAASADVRLGAIQTGSRTLPDGQTLRWQLTDPAVMVMDGVFPMLIDWGSSPHPAASAPRGCQLAELRLGHPDPAAVSQLMRAVGIPVDVARSDAPSINAVLDTPNGLVSLPQSPAT